MSQLNNLFGGGNTSNAAPLVANPQINQINQQALGNYQNLYAQAGQNSANINNNQTGYVASVVNPTIQSNATQYGNLLQSQGQRGIRGSSFGDQSISNFTNDANTNVQNATSQALQNSYGLENQSLNTQGNINSGISGIGNQMNSQQIAQYLANLQALKQNSANSSTNAGLFGGAMGGISSLFGGGGGGGIMSMFSGPSLGSGLM